MEHRSQELVASVKATQKFEKSPWGFMSKLDSRQGSSDANLFSCSLPALSCDGFKSFESGVGICSMDDVSSKLDKLGKDIEVNDSIDGIDIQGIEKFLPDEDELFDSIMNNLHQREFLSHIEPAEDCDLFSSGGGIEMDADPIDNAIVGMSRINIADDYLANINFHYTLPNGIGTIAGEHPYGEHPSRTLFVRNINSNVEDSELRSLFEQHGDIRSMYTQCKHRGFVMISYYDIRHARNAMRVLQNKPLRRRKLDIHFSIPKDNPSDKDINQGTLVAFNLDPSVSNDDLRQIFGTAGEVKEIRETPHKKHHKFIEYYDVRAAEDALRSLNGCEIAGKRIKLEPSRPGGARRSIIHQLGQELEHDEMRNYRHQVGSPLTNSPPGTWAQFSSPADTSPLKSSVLGGGSHFTTNQLSNSMKIAPIGKEHNRINRAEPLLSNSFHGIPFHQSHSFPESAGGLIPNLSCSSCIMASSGSPASSSSEIETLTGPQFLWGSPTTRTEHKQSCAWSRSSLGQASLSSGQVHGFPYLSHRGFFSASHHHAGSAPSGIPFERHFDQLNEVSDSSLLSSASFGNTGIYPPRRPINTVSSLYGSISESTSPGFRMGPGYIFPGSLQYAGHGSTGLEGFTERGRMRRLDNNAIELESKKQFQLDLDRIINGEDTRTTLMIKNIPNKYTREMLLAAIDENHKGTYDFLYLPIDFKNKCNVGYAFINMASPSHIISFHQAFSGKKWERFNSEKVSSLAYARIQGKAALVAHFQNSSLMNEDKRCRPILFDSEGMEYSDQEPFPGNSINHGSPHQEGTTTGDLFVIGENFDKLDNDRLLIGGFGER
ncbi:protein MEI2-like 2 [Phalaenopsis equestris]|uniref:protein MEI2-like 2 n=1 Tax=Phalaenopsis equestris TaxID=78828 RepID=UPI0009E47DEB|nr:protein MEI2-like 2 [Phalaenopsis equestris]